MSSSHDPYCHAVLDSALALAAIGLSVFPLKHGAKEPDTRRGFYDATCNPATIKRWFGGGYKRNLAVRTGQASGVWVLDVDDPTALENLAAQGPIPVTRLSQSSRGLHFWFKTTAIPIPSSASRVATGIDVKAEGGYVAVPPSLHPTGAVYQTCLRCAVQDISDMDALFFGSLSRRTAPSSALLLGRYIGRLPLCKPLSVVAKPS
jgi:hypothetical protein